MLSGYLSPLLFNMDTFFPIVQLSDTWPEFTIPLNKSTYFENMISKVVLSYSSKIISMPHALVYFKPFITFLFRYSTIKRIIYSTPRLVQFIYIIIYIIIFQFYYVLYILKCINDESNKAAHLYFFVFLALINLQYFLELVDLTLLFFLFFIWISRYNGNRCHQKYYSVKQLLN